MCFVQTVPQDTRRFQRSPFPAPVCCCPACVGPFGAVGSGARSVLPAPPLTLCPACSQNLTYEIILTLGQALGVAHQLALQAICVQAGWGPLPLR